MDIQKFCADVEPHNGRFPITRPWVKGGWRYATDIRIAVREKTDERDGAPGYPDVEALFAGRIVPMHDSAWTVLPTHDGKTTAWEEPACELVENPTRETCKDYGECPATHDGDCPNRVKGSTPIDQRFAGQKWGGKYIKLLNDELAGVKYWIAPSEWMHFFCGEVEGLLAPLKK